MELGARLDGHAGSVVAHGPVPLGEHGDHLEADLRVVVEHGDPVLRQGLAAAVLAEEKEERVRRQEAPHRRVGHRVVEYVGHVRHVGRPVVVRRFAVVGVQHVEDRVAHAQDAELAAHDVDAEAELECTVSLTIGRVINEK